MYAYSLLLFTFFLKLSFSWAGNEISVLAADSKNVSLCSYICVLNRCSLKCKFLDKRLNNFSRSKRFALKGKGRKWLKKSISYKISKYPRRIEMLGGREQVDKEIQRAFTVWENVTNLTFKQNQIDDVDIEISFESGEHGIGEAFDGRGGVLAHSSYPRMGGYSYIHFDDDEEWTMNSERGINLFQIATHEIGHVLGISHSKVNDSIMYLGYRAYKSKFSLHADDIQAIQTLYGQKPTISPQITTPLVSTVNSTSSSATTTLEYAGRILAINFEGKTFNDSRITTSKPETTRAIPAKFMARTDIPERDKDLAFGQRDWTTHTNVGIAVVVIVLVFLTAVSKIYYKTFVRNDAADNNYFDND